MRRVGMSIAAVGLLVLAGRAADTGPVDTPAAAQSQGPATAEPMPMPASPEEHLARAAVYREKAAAYQREAALHRKMFADYERQRDQPALRTKMGRELPWMAKMRKHCEGYIREAERLAAAANRFAEFHTMRAEEMRGN